MNREIFISYSHLDKEWLSKTQIAIKPLIRLGKINAWDDTQIRAGQNWRFEIDKALAKSKIAILLVTPNFLASDFIMNNELPYFLEKQAKENLTVLWLSVSPAIYEYTELANIQCVNNPSTTLDGLSTSEQNAIFVKLAKEINRISLF